MKTCFNFKFLGGFQEFNVCDGIAFDGLTRSSRNGVLLDGSSAFENYYPVNELMEILKDLDDLIEKVIERYQKATPTPLNKFFPDYMFV